jgi:hypothetical protein
MIFKSAHHSPHSLIRASQTHRPLMIALRHKCEPWIWSKRKKPIWASQLREAARERRDLGAPGTKSRARAAVCPPRDAVLRLPSVIGGPAWCLGFTYRLRSILAVLFGRPYFFAQRCLSFCPQVPFLTFCLGFALGAFAFLDIRTSLTQTPRQPAERLGFIRSPRWRGQVARAGKSGQAPSRF